MNSRLFREMLTGSGAILPGVLLMPLITMNDFSTM